jgi:tRNA-dihydrouridine synthase
MICRQTDVEKCLAHTGADAVMSAIGLLLDPRLFSRTAAAPAPDAIELALEYCDYAQTITTTASTSMRQHLMALLRQDMCPSYYRRGGTCDEVSLVRGRVRACLTSTCK